MLVKQLIKMVRLKKGANAKTIKKALEQLNENIKPKGVDAKKYCGTIELNEDALEYQKRLRSEWE